MDTEVSATLSEEDYSQLVALAEEKETSPEELVEGVLSRYVEDTAGRPIRKTQPSGEPELKTGEEVSQALNRVVNEASHEVGKATDNAYWLFKEVLELVVDSAANNPFIERLLVQALLRSSLVRRLRLRVETENDVVKETKSVKSLSDDEAQRVSRVILRLEERTPSFMADLLEAEVDPDNVRSTELSYG
jgi:hypothetical protein